jgi:hypothetical protein
VVVDDHAPVAVEDLAAGGQDRLRFDAVALGALVIEFRVADLQVPEPRDEKKEMATAAYWTTAMRPEANFGSSRPIGWAGRTSVETTSSSRGSSV